MNIRKYLDDLEARIDDSVESELARQWLAFSDCQWKESFFAPARTPIPARVDWPRVFINDALDNIDLMVYSQLRMCSEMLADGTGELLCVRSNFGTGIIPTMFGAELFVMPYDHDILPGTRPFAEGRDDMIAILDKGEMDFSRGLAGKVFAVAERFQGLFRDYPLIARHVHIYNPDLQGPLSLCEAMWGSDVYLEFFDDPDLVESALDFICDVYIEFTRRWKKLCPDFDGGHAVEWGMLHRGGTIIRNDSATNVSGDLYEEYVKPRDQRIIDAFGGGVHFCGKGDHYVEHLADIRGLGVINMSQPEYNNMETIYQNTVDKGILIIGLQSNEVRRAVEAGRDLRGRVSSGASMAAWVKKEDR